MRKHLLVASLALAGFVTQANATTVWNFVPSQVWTDPEDRYSALGSSALHLHGQMTVDASPGQQFTWDQVTDFNFGINGSEYNLGDLVSDDDDCGCMLTAIPDYDFTTDGEKLYGSFSIVTDEIEISMWSDPEGNWTGSLVGGAGDSCYLTSYPCNFTGYWIDPPADARTVPDVPPLALMPLVAGLLWWRRARYSFGE